MNRGWNWERGGDTVDTNASDGYVSTRLHIGGNDERWIVIGICRRAMRKADVMSAKVRKWETKEGDTHMSVYDQLRHKQHLCKLVMPA